MDQTVFAIYAAIVTSIVLEAAPFLLLGSLLSALIHVFVGEDALSRIGRGSLPRQILIGLGAGFLLPTCECGVVPVVRGLLRRGMPPGAAIPFMLAAPVLNPVSLAATWVAFRGDIWMVLGRAALVAVPAAALGFVLGGDKMNARGQDLLRLSLDMAPADGEHGCGCGCGQAHAATLPGKLFDVLRVAGREFLDMGQFLILGAALAGLMKMLLPQEWLAALSGNIFTAVPAMMLLAVVMSICSEADAFVAASLSMFPRPALLAFLALGPMLDLKLLPAYLTVFKRRPALVIILAPAAMVLILCLSLGLSGLMEARP